MTDDGDDDHGVADRDPDHIDPAADVASLFENSDATLADDADAEELREFVERAESGEFGPVVVAFR